MSAFEDIDKLLHPIRLEGLRSDTPPVSCTVWLSESSSETFDLNIYPFDTLDTIKQIIAHRFKSRGLMFSPKFTFVGIPSSSTPTTYMPFDYLWLPPGSSRDIEAIKLPDPRIAAATGLPVFTTEDGNLPPFSRSPRGRTTVEDTFLLPRKGEMPTLHIFPLSIVLPLYKGAQPINSREWNRRFAPYFPNVPVNDPLATTAEDTAFANTIYEYIDHREQHLDTVSEYLEDATIQLPPLMVTGVQQLRLILQKRKGEWDGCDTLFYRTKVNKRRPYLRLIPASGTPVTKVLVRGVLPIPALDDPDILFQWAKESPPKETEEHDFMVVKYVHRPSIGTTCPIYGTIYIYEDGTANLLLQTPKNVKKLEPTHDFRKFRELLTETLEGFPQTPSDFKLREVALTFQIQVESGSKPFQRKRILDRIPFFSSFFQVIKGEGPTDSQAMISLRYKAVSQYATESVIFSFLTQTSLALEEEGENIEELARRLQKEFQLSFKDARNKIDQWRERQGQYTLVVPEENEFMSSYNPGIDIHIFQQHPFYYFHVKRIDSYQNFRRIYSLLSLLFLDQDEYFEVSDRAEARYERQGAVLEKDSLAKEEGAVSQTVVAAAELPGPTKTVVTASAAEGPRFFGEEDEEDAEGEGEEEKEEEETAAVTTTKAAATATATATAIRALGETRFKGSINPDGWMLDTLKKLDPALFQYKPVRKGGLTYSSFCAANEDRQPAVLEPAKYQRMREEYAKEEQNGELFFNVFPVEGSITPKIPFGPKGKAKEITIMRYGSKPFDQNYYFCPELFCLFDEIMVLEDDFKSLKTRDGKPKPPRTCPFCLGGLITDKHTAMEGNTVFRRMVKPKSDKKHLYIGFTKTTTQPDGYALPCCHVKHKLLAITDDQFRHIRQVIIDRDVATILPVVEVQEGEEEGEEEVVEDVPTVIPTSVLTASVRAPETKAIPYPYLFERIHHPTTYIVSAEKHPLLTPGKFAIIPAPFDKYFQQSSSDFIQRAEIRQVLKEEGRGFLRIATEIGEMEASCGKVAQPTEALFGVLAPLLDLMSIEQVRKRILDICTPKLFAMANFGNLVNEFYRPNDPDPWHVVDAGNIVDRTRPAPITNALKQWARDNLQIIVTSHNQAAIKRIHNAHIRFIEFINDRSQRKELRHLTSFLAEPNLLTESGLQLIVLEWTPPKAREEEESQVSVRCSPYGFSMDRHRQSDFAFVWRDENGYYELFVHTRNEAKRGAVPETHDTTVRWSAYNRKEWPQLVKDRVNEYMNQCQSQYRSLYTLQRDVDTMALVPLSVAVKTLEGAIGVVRDSYNHAVLVLFQSPLEGQVVPLPVVDDGWLPIHLQLYLDMYDYVPAPIDVLQAYYKEHFATLFGIYPGYMVEGVAVGMSPVTGAEGVVAAVLKNGLYVRATDPSVELSTLGLGEPKKVEEFEWDTNRFLTELDAPCSTVVNGMEEGRDSKDLEELYQQYRYIVSKWLDSDDVTSDVKQRMGSILFSRLPTYEKRKRMEIYFGSTFRSWLSPDESAWELPRGFLRKDCRVIDDEAQCSGSCKWKSEEGVCGLHVDAKTRVGSDSSKGRMISTADVFSRRVMDELIQFPMRRKQLMAQEVGALTDIKDAIRDGDQYIIPERGATWIQMLRMDWSIAKPEEPQYYEEMSRTAGPEEAMGQPMTPELIKLFGKDAANYTLRLVPSLGALSVFGVQAAATADRLGISQLEDFAKKTGNSIGIIDLTKEPVEIMFKHGDQGSQIRAMVIVYMPTGAGILMERSGDPYIRVDLMPPVLMNRWKMTAPHVIILRRKLRPQHIPPPPPPPPFIPKTVAPPPSSQAPQDVISSTGPVVPILEADEATTGEATTGEVTSDESTSNESTSSEATTGEATSDESTSNESTSNESTSNESTSNESTSNESTSGYTTNSEQESIPIQQVAAVTKATALVAPIQTTVPKPTSPAAPVPKPTSLAAPITKATAVAVPVTKATAVAVPVTKATAVAVPVTKATAVAAPVVTKSALVKGTMGLSNSEDSSVESENSPPPKVATAATASSKVATAATASSKAATAAAPSSKAATASAASSKLAPPPKATAPLPKPVSTVAEEDIEDLL